MWGSFLGHQVFSFYGVAEFVHTLVYGSSRFTDVHEEVFSGWPDAVEAKGFGDFPEFFFCCGEGDPRGPGEGEPGGGEVAGVGGGVVHFCVRDGNRTGIRVMGDLGPRSRGLPEQCLKFCEFFELFQVT